MNKKLRDQVLAAFTLTDPQKAAALERERDVAVTAGAGSGKTSTLVARYASLLADGVDLRRVIAITFTEKAAREMRSRVRKTLSDLAESAPEEERQFWVGLNAQMDAARISTIHSLCNEILKAHPAEAVVDPRFEVLDEGLTAALRIQTVADTLARLVGMEEYATLFRVFDIRYLTELLTFMLEQRLEVREAFASEIDTNQAVCHEMLSLMNTASIAFPLAALRDIGAVQSAGDPLALQAQELVMLWDQALQAFAAGNPVTGCGFLYRARREALKLPGGKSASAAKESLKSLQSAYDELLNPICGGKDNKSAPPAAEVEGVFLDVLRMLQSAFSMLVGAYKENMRQLGALDFDDLEFGATQLLKIPQIRAKWQEQIDALLVDEFQDTNQRQRDIVEALAGDPGRLFVVGDAKQSIYRFRRADVTVFRAIRQSIRARGGLPIDLNETFRAHAPLVAGMNDVLREVMGEEEDPSRPYYEPFAPLVAHRQDPREGIGGPHIEFVLGAGELADSARPVAARALAARLLELKEQGQIASWDDVTLLFRASTGFPYYETAFEDANIPFVTVAGQGFYDRAEIRDVLNILRALADPTDDLALAGLLRSPAFGLTDAALYQLRWQGKDAAHYWQALHDDLSVLSEEDQVRASRVVWIMDELIPQVDRIPVAELLKKLVDATDYRAILAIQDLGGGGRLWRNLDKLIEDAQKSGKVNVRAFLDYLVVINDAGAREGEAPAEALGSVRLMTIHRSKGLQFPLVVLADAGRKGGGRAAPAYFNPNLGIAFRLDPEPLVYRLAKLLEKKQDEVEEHRVLYVALTRAREKLIVSGHVTAAKSGWNPAAWLDELCLAANVDINEAVDGAGDPVITKTANGHEVRVMALPADSEILAGAGAAEPELLPEPDLQPIFAPLIRTAAPVVTEDEPVDTRDWRATGGTSFIPPEVVGVMVHKAIELWRFPGDPLMLALLETAALDAGLASQLQRQAAVNEAVELLSRLRADPIFAEIEAAAERYHEVPYSRLVGDHAETGYIDLLYRDENSWQLVDFKTDAIYSEEHRARLVAEYAGQMRRYVGAVEALLGERPRVRICFLDDRGRVGVVDK